MDEGRTSLRVSAAARRLRDGLEAEATLTRRLIDLLEHERKALEAHRHDGLVETSDAKQDCLQGLESAASIRLSILEERGATPDGPGMDACIDDLDPDGRHGLRKLWRELHGLLTRCHRLNRINSQIVQTRLQTSQQAMALLHGRPPGAPQEYTRDGRTLGGSTPCRSLASA